MTTAYKTPSKTPNKTPAALFQLIVATFKHASYGDLELTIDCPYATVCFEPEHTERYVAFMDFSVWPPSPLPLPTSLDDKLFAQTWSPFYCFGDTNIWKKNTVVNAKDIYEDFFTFAQVTVFNPWAVQTLGQPTVLLSQFFKISLLVNGAIVHVNETRDIKKRWQYAVLNIGNLVDNFVGNLDSTLVNSTTLYESHRRLRIFNVQQSSQFLIVEDNKRYALCDAPLQSTAFSDLPVPAYEHSENGFFSINHDTIIYTSRIKRLHSGSSNGTEWLLKLCKLNVKTGDITTAIVDDFGSMQKQKIIDHNSNSKKNIERSNFDGNLYCHQGHDNWLVLSYKSTNKGQDDVALFFNYVSNESFKISKKDWPYQAPTIIYLRTLGRYVADSSCGISLLAKFALLYAAKEKAMVIWV